MRCPHCRTPTLEGTSECRSCGFSVAKVNLMFGTPPQLQDRINDLAGLFSASEHRRLVSRLADLGERFPQIRLDLLCTALEPGVDLRTYCFWIFNASPAVTVDLHVDDPGNHHILFTIDAPNGRANCLIGYGLEPFVSEDHLSTILSAGTKEFQARQYFQGCVQSLQALEEILTRIHGNMGRTYGIDMREFQSTEKAD